MASYFGGFGVRWDFIGVLPVTGTRNWVASTSVGMLTTAQRDVHNADETDDENSAWLWPTKLLGVLLSEAWGLFFSLLHVVLALWIWRVRSLWGSGSWLMVRLCLLVSHFMVLCMCGSIELGLRLGSSVLVPPAFLEAGDLSSIMGRHYEANRRTAPAASLFSEDYWSRFAPSAALSLLVVVLVVIDLAQVEDVLDSNRLVSMLKVSQHPQTKHNRGPQVTGRNASNHQPSAAHRPPQDTTTRRRRHA
jgi:hypothetical protein